MKLIRTLVSKDVRFAVTPMLSLTALVVVSLWARSGMNSPFDAAAGNDLPAWREHLLRWCADAGQTANLTGVLQVLFTGLLCAYLLQQDSLTSVRAFWRTRPISPGRLFVAKGSVVVATAVLLPCVGAAIVWSVLGAAPRDVWALAVPFLLQQSATAVVALGFAAVTRSLAGFVFVVLAATLVVVVSAALKTAKGPTVETGTAVFAIIVGWPFLLWLLSLPARRPARGWIAYALGLGLLPLVILGGGNRATAVAPGVSSVLSSVVLPLTAGAEAVTQGARCRIVAVARENGARDPVLELVVAREGIQLPGETADFELQDQTGRRLAILRHAELSSVWLQGLTARVVVLTAPAAALDERPPGDLRLRWQRLETRPTAQSAAHVARGLRSPLDGGGR